MRPGTVSAAPPAGPPAFRLRRKQRQKLAQKMTKIESEGGEKEEAKPAEKDSSEEEAEHFTIGGK